jgi:hypothetical protein
VVAVIALKPAAVAEHGSEPAGAEPAYSEAA